ncbi:MAG TPA: DnaJ domain-containing protein [Microvirga sp.]|nr:DnaJ domain-containing protein [Microvirga sp.]
MTLMYGAAAVFAVWWLSKVFARSNTAALARAVKVVGGVLALGAAGVLGLRGRIDMAFLLAGVAGWLLGWSVFRMPGFGALPGFGPRAVPSPGRVSRVRSAMVEMELDHDSGAMEGSVLAGAFAGRRLADLDEAALKSLYEACRASDPDGVRLLEAYLDRRFAGWREDVESDPHPGPGGGAHAGAMTEQEAYQILGLEPGAGPEEITRAHRSLMKKLHPDQGGSTYLAARVNQAKEVLLARRR